MISRRGFFTRLFGGVAVAAVPIVPAAQSRNLCPLYYMQDGGEWLHVDNGDFVLDPAKAVIASIRTNRGGSYTAMRQALGLDG